MSVVAELPYLRLQQLATDERRELALTMLDVIAPYGSVDETVVDPARFESWLIARNSAGSPDRRP
jgi:hypothetical protein